MSLIDKYTFESRSRSGCSNSDYRLCKTDCCGHFGVEDDELLEFYFDARDLSKHVFAEKGRFMAVVWDGARVGQPATLRAGASPLDTPDKGARSEPGRLVSALSKQGWRVMAGRERRPQGWEQPALPR